MDKIQHLDWLRWFKQKKQGPTYIDDGLQKNYSLTIKEIWLMLCKENELTID